MEIPLELSYVHRCYPCFQSLALVAVQDLFSSLFIGGNVSYVKDTVIFGRGLSGWVGFSVKFDVCSALQAKLSDRL